MGKKEEEILKEEVLKEKLAVSPLLIGLNGGIYNGSAIKRFRKACMESARDQVQIVKEACSLDRSFA